MAKYADYSLVLHPDHDNSITQAMFTDVLGIHPQAPFLLHVPDSSEMEEAYESMRSLMSVADGIEYSSWDPAELEPIYLPTTSV